LVPRPVLDIDLLRTLVFIAEEASFTRAAGRVGRTQPAVTLQMQKLEAVVGQPLFVRKKGGPVELTARGKLLVEQARKMLDLNDETIQLLSMSHHPPNVRLGTSEYYAPFFIDRAVQAFNSRFPDTFVELISGRSCQLGSQIKDDAFDLLVCEQDHVPRGWHSREIWRGPLRWVTSETESTHFRDPLPITVFPSGCPWRPPWMDECFWRSAPLEVLQKRGRAFRIVATSDTEAGNFSAVASGKAVTVSIERTLPTGLRFVAEDEGLPVLPNVTVVIVKGRKGSQPFTDMLADWIAESFRID
jgi:DNA-binding transcriptional LysR family regulator